jgi:hypothetical protein
MDRKNDNYNTELRRAVAFIFLLSLSIVIGANIVFFNASGYKFNTENFLTVLPFNLIGLSLSLYLVMIVIYNLGMMILKNYK